MQPVTVYNSGPECIQCRVTARVLTDAQIPHLVVDLSTHPEATRYVTDHLSYGKHTHPAAGGRNDR